MVFLVNLIIALITPILDILDVEVYFVLGDGMKDWVNGIVNNNDIYTGIMTGVTGIYDGLKPIGMSFVTLFFLIHLLDKATTDNLNVEHFFRCLIQYMIAYLVMDNGLAIMNGVMTVAVSLSSVIVGNTSIEEASGISSIKASISAVQARTDWLEGTILKFGCAMELALPFLMSVVGILGMSLVGWGRYLELYIRIAITPIAIGDFYDGIAHSPAMRWIKGLFACAMEGLIILCVCEALTVVNAAMLGKEGILNGIGALLSMGLVYLSALGVVSKAGQIAKEAIS